MALPADDLIIIRQWVGLEVDGGPTDAELEVLYDVYGNYDLVVMHVLNARLVGLTLEAGSVTVPGISVSHSSDLQALLEVMKRFRNEGGTGLEEETSFSGLLITSMKRNYPR